MKTHEPLTWLTCLALLSPFCALAAEQTAIVKDAHVNVRGQPSLAGEVITQLQQGETVVVLEEIPAAKGKTNEPAKWARIAMPAKTPVWVYAPFIEPASKAVKVARLNLRAGPGENFSVVGRLERGVVVNEIRRVNDWIEIETPPGAYAFVAADLLTKPGQTGSPVVAKQQSPPAVAPSVAPEPAKPQSVQTPSPAAEGRGELKFPPPTAAPVAAAPPEQPIATPPRSAPVASQPVIPATTETATTIVRPPPGRPETAPALNLQAKPEEGKQKRIVRRQGLVRSTVSIQAPTYYELLSPENRKTINYLHADSLDLDLKDYRGRTIIVTGEEAIDPRWPRTPVIEVETLELIP